AFPNATSYFFSGVFFRNTGFSMASASQPANWILLHEYANTARVAFASPLATTYSYTTFRYWLNTDMYDPPHMEGANLLFADGHVKWRRRDSLCAYDFGLIAKSGVPACGDAGSGEAVINPDL